jgi:hypothetical protein
MNRKCNHCVKSSVNGIVKRSNCQLAESNGIVIFIKYTAVFSVFMCWNGEWNGSEDYEESWNGRRVVSMEKLQRIIVIYKKNEK